MLLQTKNVAGRLLVGLRWWNEVTDEGSNWRFETLEEVLLLTSTPLTDIDLSLLASLIEPTNALQCILGHVNAPGLFM